MNSLENQSYQYFKQCIFLSIQRTTAAGFRSSRTTLCQVPAAWEQQPSLTFTYISATEISTNIAAAI